MTKLDKHSTFYNLLTSIRTLPLWVMQGIYVEIVGLMRDKGNKTSLHDLDRADLLQLYVPILSGLGKKLLEQDSRERKLGSVDENLLNFLESAKMQRTVIDICVANKWTLEECSNVILEAIRNNYVERTYTPIIHTTLLFITGNIKVGEFLVRKGAITQHQLDWALQVQGDMDDTFDDKNRIVEVLTNLNYIEKDVIADYLSLKDFAKTYFKFSDNTKPLIDIIDQQEEEINSLANTVDEKDKALNDTQKENKKLENKVNELQENFETLQKKNAELSNELEQYQKKFGLFNKL